MASPENLTALSAAMAELQGEVIAVPPLLLEHLESGLAIHFRCHAPGVEGLRVDVMSHMRGVAPFPELWARSQNLSNGGGVLALPDLVNAQKTQRDKDWPMIRRLLEADYIRHPRPTSEQLAFWLQECRTPEILCELVLQYPSESVRTSRPVIQAAFQGATHEELTKLLLAEEAIQRTADIVWRTPRKQHLEALRRQALQ